MLNKEIVNRKITRFWLIANVDNLFGKIGKISRKKKKTVSCVKHS